MLVGDDTSSSYDFEAPSRYQNITIPHGSIIVSAIYKIKAYRLLTSIPTTHIYAEDIDNSPEFTTFANYSARARTGNYTVWTPSAWVQNTEYSVDITDVIQEVIDRAGWQSGNSLSIFWQHETMGWGGVKGLITTWSYSNSKRPILEITWAEPESDPPVASNTWTSMQYAGQNCTFYTKWTDDTSMAGYVFGTDNSGSWVNDTWTGWSPEGSPAWSNVTKTLTSSVGVTVGWRVWANDSWGNWGDTGIQYLTTKEALGWNVFEVADAGTTSSIGIARSFSQSAWYGEEHLWVMWYSGSSVWSSSSGDNGTTWTSPQEQGSTLGSPDTAFGSCNDLDYVYLVFWDTGSRSYFMRGEFRQTEEDIVWDAMDRRFDHSNGVGYYPTVEVDNTTRKFTGFDWVHGGQHDAMADKGDQAGSQFSVTNYASPQGDRFLETNCVQTRVVPVIQNRSHAGIGDSSNRMYYVWSSQDKKLQGELLYNEDTSNPADAWSLKRSDGEFTDYEPQEEYSFATCSNYLTGQVYVAYVQKTTKNVRLATVEDDGTIHEIEVYSGAMSSHIQPWVSVSSFSVSTDDTAKDKVYVVWRTEDYPAAGNYSIWMSVVDYSESDAGEASEAFLLYSSLQEMGMFNMFRYSYKEAGADYDKIRFIIAFTLADDDSANYDIMAIVFDPKVLPLQTPPPQSMSVVLNTPVDGFEGDTLSIDFGFTPMWENVEIAKASLHVSDGWNTHHWNASSLAKDAENTISHTFATYGVYTWNVQLFNATTSIWATSNYILTLQPRCGPSPPPSIHFHAYPADLGEAQTGTTVPFSLAVEFDAYRVTVSRVEFGEHSDWFKFWNTLPQAFDRGAEVLGNATLDAQLTTPAVAGSYTIPFTVYGASPDGRHVQSAASVTFTAVTPGPSGPPYFPSIEEIVEAAKRLLGNPEILLLLALAVAWFSYYSLKKR